MTWACRPSALAATRRERYSAVTVSAGLQLWRKSSGGAAGPCGFEAGMSQEVNRSPLWLRHAIVVGLLGMFLGALSRLTVVDLDLFHELALIRETVVSGHLPVTDCFAYTPTIQPVIHHEWGTGAVLYGVVIGAGLGAGGLMLLKYVLSGLIVCGCALSARRRGSSWIVFSFLAPLAIELGWLGFSTIRAQLFTLAFLVCLVLFLHEETIRRDRLVFLWLPIHVVWVNMHGGVLAGLGLFGIHTLEEFLREWRTSGSLPHACRRIRYLAAGFLMLVLLLAATPYGLNSARFLWQSALMARPLIGEWAPLWQAGSPGTTALFAVSVATVGYAGRVRGVASLPGLAMLSATAVMAWQHQRHLPIYAIAWICLVPAWLQTTPMGLAMERVGRNHSRFLVIFWLVCGFVGTAFACQNRFWRLRIPTQVTEATEGVPVYPAGAVDYLASTHFEGNLMVPFETGAFVSWRLYPMVRVSIDSRYEVAFPPGAVEESVQFYRGESEWRSTLSRYSTDAILVPWWSPVEVHLAQTADQATARDWKRVYTDGAYSLYFRADQARDRSCVDRTGDQIPGEFP